MEYIFLVSTTPLEIEIDKWINSTSDKIDPSIYESQMCPGECFMYGPNCILIISIFCSTVQHCIPYFCWFIC